MTNIVLFGKPGAGKGTQAEFLKEKYKLTHISTGDVFRFNLKNDTELGKQARVYMDAGDLVPDELTTKMLIDEVNKHPDTAQRRRPEVDRGHARTDPHVEVPTLRQEAHLHDRRGAGAADQPLGRDCDPEAS